LIATVDYNGSTTTVYHDHTDHLTGTGTITSSTPAEIQTLDYFAFGEQRINDKAGAFDEQVEYAGSEYDHNTSLNYMNARYFNGNQGRFISEDPIFLLAGSQNFDSKWNTNWRNIPKGDEIALSEYLSNPQNLNSYSYVTNNPLKYIDPTGEFEVHFSLTTNMGLGGSAGSVWSFGFASDGSYGASSSWQAGGFAGADLSVGMGLGYSNAKTWNDIQGKNNYVGGGAKLGVGVDAGLNFSGDGKYTGADIGGGIGLSSPLYLKGGMGNTTIHMDRNIIQDLRSIGQGISNAIDYTAKSAVNLVDKIIN